MVEEGARFQSKCLILIFLAIQGMPMESVLCFPELIFGCDILHPHSPLKCIFVSVLQYSSLTY